MALTDIHTHIIPSPPGTALYCLPLLESVIPEGVFCSVGIHPWDLVQDCHESLEWVERMLSNPSVKSVGEIGLDSLRGPSADIQTEAFTAQISLSELYRKPVILHVVRTLDRILALRRLLKPEMPWLIHGFRGNAAMARQILDNGMLVSFGPVFNADALIAVGLERALIETDGRCDVRNVIELFATTFQVHPDTVINAVSANAASFLGGAV